MVDYYSSNALYDHLSGSDTSDLFWVAGNSWVLVYGDKDRSPKVIVFVCGESISSFDGEIRDRLLQTHAIAENLAHRASLPFATIKFDDNAEEVTSVNLNGDQVDLSALKSWFAAQGLPVEGNVGTAKAINDASSSAYHNWQRSSLGRIVVSDVDLIRIDTQSKAPLTIYELKRSYLPIERWTPFRDDYANFDLLAELCRQASVDFNIVYNVRTRPPAFFDDVSSLKMFSYSQGRGAELIGIVSLNEFICGAGQ